jgi:hypothetical protein
MSPQWEEFMIMHTKEYHRTGSSHVDIHDPAGKMEFLKTYVSEYII